MRKILTVTSFAFLLVLAFASPTPVLSEEAEASDVGMELYNKKCAMCHGKDGVAKSMAKGSANLNDAEWKASTSVDDLAKLITEGKGKMKGFDGKLEPDQIQAVATYTLKL